MGSLNKRLQHTNTMKGLVTSVLVCLGSVNAARMATTVLTDTCKFKIINGIYEFELHHLPAYPGERYFSADKWDGLFMKDRDIFASLGWDGDDKPIVDGDDKP